MSEDISILSMGRKRQYGTLETTSNYPSAYKLHYIAPGDTLVSIAVHYGTTVHQLKLLNKLWTTEISNMTSLKVPVKSQFDSSTTKNGEAIELSSVRQKKSSCSNDGDPSANTVSPSNYLKELSDRIEKIKESASSCLENSRLCEIIAHVSPGPSTPSLLSSQTHRNSDHSAVVVASPTHSSTTSSLNGSRLSFQVNLDSLQDSC